MIVLNILADGLHFITHLNDYLNVWIREYGNWLYAILFLIVFVETGLVVMPLLPGDSLLFAAGALAANPANDFSIFVLIPLLIFAALLGDNTNYFIGSRIGVRIFDLKWKLLKREYLDKTHAFYEKHGGKTLIMARFVPIVRTFAPFAAGLGTMGYRKFIGYCISGAVLWVCSISIAGYLLGSNEWVMKNFEKVVLGIIFISILPMIFQALKSKFAK
ncbi:MAG: DedA family protein [Bacteroidetes bacterium]|jgi:membrane-associated protein|nr:DedA family protein [Bacteroidota bacterium]